MAIAALVKVPASWLEMAGTEKCRFTWEGFLNFPLFVKSRFLSFQVF